MIVKILNDCILQNNFQRLNKNEYDHFYPWSFISKGWIAKRLMKSNESWEIPAIFYYLNMESNLLITRLKCLFFDEKNISKRFISLLIKKVGG